MYTVYSSGTGVEFSDNWMVGWQRHHTKFSKFNVLYLAEFYRNPILIAYIYCLRLIYLFIMLKYID